MNKITYVYADDFNALYVDGELVSEPETMAYTGGPHHLFQKILDEMEVDYEYEKRRTTYEFLKENHWSVPKQLKDVEFE